MELGDLGGRRSPATVTGKSECYQISQINLYLLQDLLSAELRGFRLEFSGKFYNLRSFFHLSTT